MLLIPVSLYLPMATFHTSRPQVPICVSKFLCTLSAQFLGAAILEIKWGPQMLPSSLGSASHIKFQNF